MIRNLFRVFTGGNHSASNIMSSNTALLCWRTEVKCFPADAVREPLQGDEEALRHPRTLAVAAVLNNNWGTIPNSSTTMIVKHRRIPRRYFNAFELAICHFKTDTGQETGDTLYDKITRKAHSERNRASRTNPLTHDTSAQQGRPAR